MEFSRILYSVSGRRATITLDRPETLNALDDVAITELTAAMTAAGRDSAVKVILLQASGAAFSTGMDVGYLARIAQLDLEVNRQDSLRVATCLRVIHDLRKPVIAVVQGPALGTGVGLVCAADFVLAAKETARFGIPDVRIGVIPALTLVFLIKRVGEGRTASSFSAGGRSQPRRPSGSALSEPSFPRRSSPPPHARWPTNSSPSTARTPWASARRCSPSSRG